MNTVWIPNNRAGRRKALALGLKNKGGLTCTTSLAAIATNLRAIADTGVTTAIIDADGFNRSMTAIMGERDAQGKLRPEMEQTLTAGVLQADIFEHNGGRKLYEAMESDADIVIIDAPAGSLDQLERLSENQGGVDFMSYANEVGRDVTIFLPINCYREAILGARLAIDRFSGHGTLVLGREMIGKTEDDYMLWSKPDMVDFDGQPLGGQTRKLLKAAGGMEFDIPTCNQGSLALCRALGMTFEQAAQEYRPPWEGWHRRNIANWLSKWRPVMDQLTKPLGLGPNISWRAW